MAMVGGRKRPVRPPAPSGFVASAPFIEVVRAIHASGLSLRELARFTGVGYTLMRDLHQGNSTKLQRGTAEHLGERLLQLLPSEVAS
jgi:hypothetical protein